MKSDYALRELAKNARAYDRQAVGLPGIDVAALADELLLLRAQNHAMRKRVGNLRRAVRGLNKAYESLMLMSEVRGLRKSNDALRELVEPPELTPELKEVAN